MWPIAQRAVDRMRLRGAVDWLGPLAPAEIVSELQDGERLRAPLDRREQPEFSG